MTSDDGILIYAHLGDLHLTTESEDNYVDLRAIVSEISTDLADTIDFVYVPGDNADNGLPEQYALAARELARLPMPVHVVTGDHDMEPGNLDNFYRSLGVARLPKAVEVGDVSCLFLDICGPGSGGPDFRLGVDQTDWLTTQLDKTAAAGRRCAIFMHSYPADLRGLGETATINKAFETREVLLVDMGHTHYNELTNDGRTIFAATRSPLTPTCPRFEARRSPRWSESPRDHGSERRPDPDPRCQLPLRGCLKGDNEPRTTSGSRLA